VSDQSPSTELGDELFDRVRAAVNPGDEITTLGNELRTGSFRSNRGFEPVGKQVRALGQPVSETERALSCAAACRNLTAADVAMSDPDATLGVDDAETIRGRPRCSASRVASERAGWQRATSRRRRP
jgi:hypothetical protein